MNGLIILKRHFLRYTVYFLINLVGLVLSFTSIIFIALFVQSELSFDDFHRNGDRIYRITNEMQRGSGNAYYATCPPVLAQTIKSTFPQAEETTRIRFADNYMFQIGENKFIENFVFYAEPSFFDLFSFKLLRGEKQNLLENPNEIILSESTAIKFFGSTDVLGKTVQVNSTKNLKVVGIMEDVPENSHLIFDVLISFETFQVPFGYNLDLNSWNWYGFSTYARLKRGADKTLIEKALGEMYKLNTDNPNNLSYTIRLQPLKSIYFNSSEIRSNPYVRVGNSMNIAGLSTVAMMILIIAIFNYANLTSALSQRRFKDTGIRKILGARDRNLIVHNVFSSTILCSFSFVLSVILVLAFAKTLAKFLHISFNFESSHLIPLLIPLVCILALTSLAASVESSLFQISLKATDVIKGKLHKNSNAINWSKGMVVIQFTIATALITGSLFIHNQLQYILQRDLGFDKENVVVLKLTEEGMDKYYNNLRTEFLQVPGIKSVSMGRQDLTGSHVGASSARLKGQSESSSLQTANLHIHYDFLETLQIQLLEGRFFSRDFPDDSSTSILLNRKAAQAWELEEPLGTKIITWDNREVEVVGIVEDFHFESLHSEVSPTILFFPYVRTNNLFIRLESGNYLSTLEDIDKIFDQVASDEIFDLSFLDGRINSMYSTDQQYFKLISIFTIISILVSLIGIYGLIRLTINSKFDEIVIRKVLGANIRSLYMLVLKPHLRMVLIGSILAIPLAFWATTQWLNSFSFKISLSPIVFLLSISMIIVLTLVITYQTCLQAAKANIAQSLRKSDE